MITYAEKKAPKGAKKITNQFTHFLEPMDLEERQAVPAIVSTSHNNTSHKMKNLSKLMFPQGTSTVSQLRTKLSFLEQIMIQVTEFLFIKQYANQKGIIDWETAKKTIDDMKLDLAKEEGKVEGISEAESRRASDGSGDVRMG